jgi:hypothetical protein
MVNIKVKAKKIGEETKNLGENLGGKIKGLGTKMKTLPSVMIGSRKNLSILAIVIVALVGLTVALSYQPSREAIIEKLPESLPFVGEKLPDEMVVLIQTDSRNFIPLTMLVSQEGKVISISPIEGTIEVEISSNLFEKLEENPAFETEWQKGKSYQSIETPFQKLINKYSEVEE